MINTGTATPRLDLLGPILEEGIPDDAYVAHRILPPLVVQKRIAAIPSFLFTDAQALSIKHAPKTAFAQIQSKLGQASYSCTEAGVEEPLSYEDYEILGRDYAQELIARKLMHVVLRARDYALAAAIMSATGETTFATNLVTAANAWNTASGVPLDNVLRAKRNIALQTGLPGNCMIISYDLYVDLCKNSQIQTLVRNVMGYGGAQFTNNAVVNEIPINVLAQTFGLEEIIVAPGVVDANGEGAASKSLSFIWPRNYAFVFRRNKNANDVREVGLGRTFVYDLANEFNELTTMNVTDMAKALWMEQYARPDTNSDVLRCREYIDMVVLFAKAGALIKSV